MPSEEQLAKLDQLVQDLRTGAPISTVEADDLRSILANLKQSLDLIDSMGAAAAFRGLRWRPPPAAT